MSSQLATCRKKKNENPQTKFEDDGGRRSWIMRLFYQFLHIGAIICLFVGALSADQKAYRRCIGEKLANDVGEPATTIKSRNLLTTLHQETSCEFCSQGYSCSRCNNPPEQEYPYHVMMFISEFHEDFLSLAAGLLDSQFIVTVQLLTDKEDEIEDTYDAILSRISCKSESKIKDNLTVFKVKLTPGLALTESCKLTSNHLLDMCAIITAPRMLTTHFMMLQDDMNNGILGNKPDLLVMDASLVAGLLLAEKNMIPTVTIGTHTALDLAIEHDPDWIPNPDWGLFYRYYRIFRQRYYSMSLTAPFVEMNRLRRKAGLQPLKSPHDYLTPVVAMLLEYEPSDYLSFIGKDYWKQVHVIGALQPPCIPCTPLPKVTQGKKRNVPIVIVSLPAKQSADDVRSLLKGLILARSLLEKYDECEWDSLSCRNEATEFQIIWLDYGDNMDFFPEVVPAFVTRETSTNLLDSLVRHPSTIAVIAHCDSNTPVVSALGVSVVCVSQSERIPKVSPILLDQTGHLDHREIARRLISSLRSRTVEYEKSSTRNDNIQLDGIHLAVAMIRLVASTQRRYRHSWRNDVRRMQQVVSKEIHNALGYTTASQESNPGDSDISDDSLPYDTFTVLIALIVLIISTCYLLFLDFLSPLLRPRRTHRVADSQSDGILNRLPDLDDAWAAFVEWSESRPSLTDDYLVDQSNPVADSSHDRRSSHTNSHGNHHHHNHHHRRKKRK